MSDGTTPRQKWEQTGTTCPFCGNEEFYEPCDHLIADFPETQFEGSGAIGECWSNSVLSDPARDLGLACVGLLKAFHSGDNQWDSDAWRLKLESLVAKDAAPWWSELIEEIEDNEDYDEGDDHLGRLATPIVSVVARGVAGVLESSDAYFDVRTSGIIFLWSDDREAATTAVRARVEEATERVRHVTAALSAETDQDL